MLRDQVYYNRCLTGRIQSDDTATNSMASYCRPGSEGGIALVVLQTSQELVVDQKVVGTVLRGQVCCNICLTSRQSDVTGTNSMAASCRPGSEGGDMLYKQLNAEINHN